MARTTLKICVLAGGLAVLAYLPAASAVEIFRWVDDEGVIHFSDERPAEAPSDVAHFVIAPENAADYDPQDDPYSIMNQAARTSEAYKKVEERRAERAAKRAEAAEKAARETQFVRYYDEPARTYFVPYYRPWRPWRPRPEHLPAHPIRPPHGRNPHRPGRGERPGMPKQAPNATSMTANPNVSSSGPRWSPARQLQ